MSQLPSKLLTRAGQFIRHKAVIPKHGGREIHEADSILNPGESVYAVFQGRVAEARDDRHNPGSSANREQSAYRRLMDGLIAVRSPDFGELADVVRSAR